MPSKEENELLCRTGPGTPTGELRVAAGREGVPGSGEAEKLVDCVTRHTSDPLTSKNGIDSSFSSDICARNKPPQH